MNVYFLSGLGADSRALSHLKLPQQCNAVFIEWLIPLKNETIHEYAKRIASGIDTSSPFILVGLSFGGILATEVQEFVKPVKTILISSVACRKELPLLYRFAGTIHLHKILPSKTTNRSNFFTYWMFGINDEKDKHLLKEILTSTNTQFSKWAINEIVNWRRNQVPSNIIRIHGTKDRILPVRNFKPDFIVPDGGHFMVVNKAAEVSAILKTIIEE